MTTKNDLLIANKFHPDTVAELDKIYTTHHLWKYSQEDKIKLIRQLDGHCRAVATGSWACDELVYELGSLQLISCFGVGVDGINLELTDARDIKVTNTPGVLEDAVADIALALILNTMRNIINADKHVRSGEWPNKHFRPSHSLAGKTLGILGLGRIGEEIAHRALPFKLNIAYHNRTAKNLPYTYCSSLNELATQADILMCALPGGDGTRNIVNADVLAALGPRGIFINVGRGSSVDEIALTEALKNGTIAGAGLDVFADEPNVPEDLRTQNNAVLLPHIGSGTIETRLEMGRVTMKNLQAFFDNRPLPNEVNFQ